MTTLTVLMPEEIESQWDRVEPLFITVINRANEPEFGISDLKAMAINKSVLIAYIEESGTVLMALAMEIIRYRKITALNVLAMAGQRMQELFAEHSPEIKRFAKSFGATHFQASGTAAMAKLFRRLGYYSAYEVMRHKL
jgi:hypothetical protein